MDLPDCGLCSFVFERESLVEAADFMLENGDAVLKSHHFLYTLEIQALLRECLDELESIDIGL